MKAIHSKRAPDDTSRAGATAERTTSHAKAVKRAKAAEKETTAAKNKPARAGAAARAPVGTVSAVGDSVMLGSANYLYRDIDNLTVMDAEVGLQASGAIDILRRRRAMGQLGDEVIVHIGTNGIVTPRQFEEMMRILSGVRRVVVVNVNVPRVWERPNNEMLAKEVRRYPNAVLVDWYSASVDHPEYFVSDGVHLTIKGERVYAGLISKRL